MAKMKLHDETHCLWCRTPLPTGVKSKYPNFCSGKCAWSDGDDHVATERDKWNYYNGN